MIRIYYKRLILPFLFLLSSFYFFSVTAVGYADLRILKRPDKPATYPIIDNYNTKLTQHGKDPRQYPITMTLHHIIPFNTLRDFYNSVLQKEQIKYLSGFLNKVSEKMINYACPLSSYACDTSKTKQHIEQAKSVLKKITLGQIVQKDGAQTPEGYNTFEEFYTWMPWNLFVGPSPDLRSNDPGENFEVNAENIVNNQSTWKKIVNVNKDMVTYIAETKGDAKLLSTINNNLTQLAAKTTIYPLQSLQWVYASNKYYIKKM